jgi:DNA-directed RNA polymerase specialized sigma24 family protein
VQSEQEQPAMFAQRFLRSYRLLNFIAERLLGGQDRAAIAIQNCWRTASRKPPRVKYEGAFRSWLLRVLIDEALALLRANQGERNTAAAVVSAVSPFASTVCLDTCHDGYSYCLSARANVSNHEVTENGVPGSDQTPPIMVQ